MTTTKTKPKLAPEAAGPLSQQLADVAEAEWQQLRAAAWSKRLEWVEAIKLYRAEWDAEGQLRFDRENVELRERGNHEAADRHKAARLDRQTLDEETRRVRSPAAPPPARHVGRAVTAGATWKAEAQARARTYVDAQRARVPVAGRHQR